MLCSGAVQYSKKSKTQTGEILYVPMVSWRIRNLVTIGSVPELVEMG